MKRLIFLVMVVLAGCQPKEPAPQSLANQGIVISVTSASGSAAQYSGKKITTNFADTNYVGLGPNGNWMNQGPYAYRKTGPKTGALVIQPTAGAMAGSVWVNELTFSTSKEGHISGKETRGGTGSMEGQFKLHK